MENFLKDFLNGGLAKSLLALTLVVGARFGYAADAPTEPIIQGGPVVWGARTHYVGFLILSPVFGISTHGGSTGLGGSSGGGIAPPDGGKADQNSCGEGDPVIVATGNRIEPETDFTVGGEAGFILTRTYNHHWEGVGLFGRHWTSSLDFKLLNDDSGFGVSCQGTSSACWIGSTFSLAAWRPDGGTVTFKRNPNNPSEYLNAQQQLIEKIVIQPDGSAVLVGNDGTTERYGVDGRVLSVKSAQGVGWTFAYSGGHPITLTHTSGRVIKLGWNGSQLTSVSDPNDDTYQYGYANGKLTSVTKPGLPATTITYHYELPSDDYALTGKSVNGVRYSRFGYDANGRASSTTQNGTNNFSFVYTDGPDGLLSVLETNPLGKQTTWVFKNEKPQSVTGWASTYCPSTYSETNYDDNGFVSLESDFNGNITTYAHNGKGQLLSKIEGYGTPEARKTSWVWDAVTDQVVSVTVGGATSGAELYRDSYTYTADQRLKSVTRTDLSESAAVAPANRRTTNYTYEEYPSGLLKSLTVDGPFPGAGDSVTTSFGAERIITNGLGQSIVFSNFNGRAQPGRITDANGSKKDYTYDAQGRVINVRTYVNAATQDYKATYNAYGKVASSVLPGGLTTTFAYAGGNPDWLSAMQTQAGPGVDGRQTYQGKKFERDAFGDVTSESTYVLRPSSPGAEALQSQPSLTEVADTSSILSGDEPTLEDAPLIGDASETQAAMLATEESLSGSYVQDIKTSSFTDYDELGHVRSKRGNHGQNFRYTYDDNGNVKTIVDSLGHVTTLAYDALNRLKSSTDPKSGVTTYVYDTANHVTKVIDARGKATTYAYNGFGDLLQQVSPDTGTTRFAYDAYGRQQAITRADGKVTTFEHDEVGRLTKATAANGQAQIFQFDICPNGIGHLCATSDPSGAVNFSYTPEGWLASKSASLVSGAAPNLSYEYDEVGRVITINYPNSVSATYTYYYGQPHTLSVTQGGLTTSVVTSAKYLPYGSSTGWAYGNGLNRSLQYDLDGRLTGIATSSASNMVQSLTYGYNANDVITKITNAVSSGLSQAYEYDELSRLTSIVASNGNDSIYTYDAVGNRKTATRNGVLDTYSVSTASNRLLSVSGGSPTTFSYDSNGNVKSGDGVTYTYDSFNRLSNSEFGNFQTSYDVNALGQRVYKKVNGTNYWFVYGQDNSLLAEYRSGLGWTQYLRFNGEPVALVRNGAVTYVSSDHLSRPEVATNGSKVITWLANNYAFDRTIAIDSIGGLNVGFPGQYFDGETGGNWSNGYRDTYDSDRGRFLQSDPTGLNGGINTFSYVENAPTALVDPLGLKGYVCKQGDDVGIAIPINFQNATSAQINQIVNAIQNAWSGTFGSLHVKTVVRPVGQWNASTNGIAVVMRDAESWVSTPDMNSGNWSYPGQWGDATFAHEAGHLLGLGDNGPGIMGGDLTAPVNEQNINGVLDSSNEAITRGCGCE